VNNTVLLQFVCQCGYVESIGVGVACGLVIKGDITIVCPKCGRIQILHGVTAINHVSKT
jgi:hypothetical protein